MPQWTMVEAINRALHWEMEHNPDVVVLGEDVGVNGGVFRATLGLREAFGLKRVIDTPLAENAIAGLSVGLAAQGMRPVAEIQFMGFIYPALDQIISHAARLRSRTRGRLTCPMVVRTPAYGGIHAPEHHSESTEALLCHIPGLRVVIPSSPRRAYGLLLAAMRSSDPVIFLEPSRLYRSAPQEVADNGEALPLDHCFSLREGGDLTLISWGAMVPDCLQAAEQLAEEGIEVSVLDVATLAPLDRDALTAAVGATGRCLIVHEAPLSFGPGAEIAATVAERGLYQLKAPPRRVTGFDCPIPYARLERTYIPSIEQIVAAARELVAQS